MTLNLIYIVAGLALLIQGGNLFVAAALRIAEFLRLPRVVVGSTLVSLATTTPEMVVSIFSGMKGESELAVGNAVGSCICNIGLILGVTASLKHVEVNPASLRVPLAAMFGFGILLFCFTTDLVLSREQGVILALGGVGYFVFDFWRHWRDKRPADVREAAAIEKETAVAARGWFQSSAGTAIQFLGGAGIVVVGSKLLVDGAVNIAGAMGIPSIVIGLTVVALGTSLPELVTAITSSRRSVSDLAIGNILGANIANLTMIVGVAAVIHEVRIERMTMLLNFPAMLLIMLLLLWCLWNDRKISREEGWALLFSYGLYLWALLAVTITGQH